MLDESPPMKDVTEESLLFALQDEPRFGRLTSHPDGMGSMLLLTQGTSLRGTMFNLLNTMIGGGVLGLPFAARQTGALISMVLLGSMAVLTDLTAWMLLVSVDFARESSYAMVAEVLYGLWLGVLVDLAVLCNNFGVLVSYVCIIGDLVPPFVALWGAPAAICSRAAVLWMSAFGALLPLSLLRSMGALRHASLVCMVMIMLFMFVMVAMGSGLIDVGGAGADEPVVLAASSFSAVAGQMPVVMFAYNCLMNVPFLYTELRRQKHQDIGSKFSAKRSKMMFAVHVSIAVCVVIYSLVSVFGYLAFGDSTKPDILTNLSSDIFAPAPYVKICYSLVIFCSYPVMCFSCVASFHRLALHCLAALRANGRYEYRPFEAWTPTSSPRSRKPMNSALWSPGAATASTATASTAASESSRAASPSTPLIEPLGSSEGADSGFCEPPSEGVRRVESLAIVMASTAIGAVVPDISIVFCLTGGLCGGALTFIFPGLFFIRVQSRSVPRPVKAARNLLLGHGVFWFGIVASFGATAVTIWQL